MRHVKPYRGVRGGPRTAPGRAIDPDEGQRSGAGFQKALGGMHERLAEVVRQERQEARTRQEAAGVTPIRTDFRKTGDVELERALDQIWQAGKESKMLYIKLAKGLSCLTRDDVLALSQLGATEIEALAPDLAAGATLKS